MRRLFPVLVLSLLALAAFAQEAPQPLAISKSLLAIKITDPARQITAFEPLLSRIDGLIEDLNPGKKILSAELGKGLTEMAKVPGIDATGNFWFVIMPPTEKPAAAGAKNDDKAAPSVTAALLVPLKDAQQFKDFAANAKEGFKNVQVFDKYMIAGDNLPKFSAVDANVTLLSKRDIVLLAHLSVNPLDNLGKMPEVLTNLFGSLSEYINLIIKNQQSCEVGLAVIGDDLSLESFLTPVPDSPLAKSLTAQKPSEMPLQLAGYLPENLAFCSASGPMLDGNPGTGYVVSRAATGLLTSFLDEETSKLLNKQLDLLTAQCKNGRAIGMTVPPSNLSSSATLVAVYQIEKSTEATAAVRGFVEKLTLARDTLMGGMLTDVIKVFTTKEMIDATPVDLVKVIINIEDQGAAPKPFTIETRVAFTTDKMLVAIGDNSKTEITNMIKRIKVGTAGFTSGKRFIAMKAGIPQGARGFETFAPLDLCRAGASLAPVDPATKKQFTAFLKIFPDQKNVINDYQVVRDGRLYSEFRIPGEQLDFFCSLVKAGAAFNNEKTDKPAAKPAEKPAEPAKK